MRRTDLERKLEGLGWSRGTLSGRIWIWRHPRRRDPLYVPDADIIADQVGNELLEEAKG